VETALQGKHRAQAESHDADPMFDLIELLFFAYRDFVGDADRLLESYKFGRAHHRVLHFVSRHPGLTIAELLDILKITKQSLSRVLKELLDQNFVEARAGVADRRQRHLYPTAKGRKLALELAQLQSRRFARALDALPANARQDAIRFLMAMIDPADHDEVKSLVWPQAMRTTP
jgi:DNA-binding MarR family transcriptional regulator